MRRALRKTTPRVKDGRVQRKNYRDEWSVDTGPLEVVTEVPGPGYRHVLDEALLREFMALVPDSEQVSRGLRTMTHHDWEFENVEPDTVICFDPKTPGRPAICDVVYASDAICVYERNILVRFDRKTAADYMLLHVFLHELGHHVDAMAPPRKGRTTRGEDYAELWALRTADAMWDAWVSRR